MEPWRFGDTARVKTGPVSKKAKQASRKGGDALPIYFLFLFATSPVKIALRDGDERG